MIYVIVCIIAWAAWSVTQKLALKNSSPLMLQIVSSYVYSIVGPTIFLYMKATGKDTTWNAHSIVWTAISCVLAVIGGLSFAAAIQKQPVGTVVGLTSAYPVLTFVMTSALLGEPVTLRKVVGIVIAVIGVIVLGSSS